MVLAVLSGPIAGRACGGNLPDDFSQKYEPAVEMLQGLYTHATINGTVKREYPQSGKSSEQKYVLRIAGSKMRLDVTTIGGKNMGKKVGTTEVFFAIPGASFYGIGAPGSVGIDTSTEWTYEQTKARIQKAFPIDQPFSLGANRTILELLSSPQVKVDSLKKVKRKGEHLVKIAFDDPTGGHGKEAKSWVLLSPSEAWGVRAYSRTTGVGNDEMTYRGNISYGKTRERVPVVEMIESWQEQGPRRELILHEVIAISRFVADDPADVTFTADGFD